MPTPSYGLSSPKKRAIDPKVCRIARKVCREKSVWHPKIEKGFEILPNFSRQGYASDFRSRQSFLTTSVPLAGEVRYLQQALSCCVALVLLWVISTHTQCSIRSKKRQTYESIAANLSDESQRPCKWFIYKGESPFPLPPWVGFVNFIFMQDFPHSTELQCPRPFYTDLEALIIASATLCASSLAHGSSRRTEGGGISTEDKIAANIDRGF